MPKLLFGCAWHWLLESEGSIQFEIMFGCANCGNENFVEFVQCTIVYMDGTSLDHKNEAHDLK